MAELKFTKCENERALCDIKDGDLTDYIFMMYRSGEDGWYKNSLLPSDAPLTSPVFAPCMQSVCEYLRVTLSDDNRAVFFSPASVIARLNTNGQKLGFAEVDSVVASYAICELIKLEKRFLTKDSFLLVKLTLTSCDESAQYPIQKAMFTASVRYFEKKPQRSITADCIRANSISFDMGTSDYESTCFKADTLAFQNGFDKAMLTDALYGKYIKGICGMNVFFRTPHKIITPKEGGCMVAGIMRRLITEWGIEFCEREISVDELEREFISGNIKEIFAASDKEISIFGESVRIGGKTYALPRGKLAKKLYDSILNIERGVLTFTDTTFERI